MVPDAMILVFWMLSYKPNFSLFSFTFIKRFFSSSSLSAISVLSSAYLRLLILLLAILIPACASSSLAFLNMWKWKWSLSVVSNSLWPVDYSPPSSSVHGILQARILGWVAISFSRGSSWPRDRTQVSHIAGRHFNLCTTREALGNALVPYKWNYICCLIFGYDFLIHLRLFKVQC